MTVVAVRASASLPDLIGFIRDQKVLKNAKHHIRRKQEHNNALVCQHWDARDGQKRLNESMQRFPALCDQGAVLLPEPHNAPTACAFMRWSYPVQQAVPRIIAFETEHQPAELQNIMQLAEARFKSQTSLLEHEKCPPLADDLANPPRRTRTKPTCLEARTCLCGEKGDRIHLFFFCSLRTR